MSLLNSWLTYLRNRLPKRSPAHTSYRTRGPHRSTIFERFEERRVLTTTILFPFSDGRPTVDRIGTITSTNRVDTYQITLTSERPFQANLSGMSANLNFVLTNPDGTVLASSQQSGTALDSFAIDRLHKGQYLLNVVPVGSAQSRYRLTLSIHTDDELLTTATDLGTIAPNWPALTAANSLYGPTEFQDYYRFNASANVPLRLALSGLSNDINVQVLNKNGVLVAQASAALAAVEDITFTPTYSGLFYARVWTGAQTYSKYRLDITRDVTSDDLFVSATSVGTLTADRPAVRLREYIGQLDATHHDMQDYYRFALTSTATVRFNFSANFEEAEFELLDQLGRVIPLQRTIENDVENLLVEGLAAGRYVLHVFKDHTAAQVSLAYFLTMGINIHSDDFATNATDLGLFDMAIHRSMRLIDFVGGETDVQDYFTFTLPVASAIHFSLSVESADLSIGIWHVGGSESMGSTTVDLLMSKTSYSPTFSAGTYLVNILASNRTLASNYAFTLSIDNQGDDVEGLANQLGMLVPVQRPTVRASSTVGGPLDLQDCYRFTLQTPGNVYVALSGLTADLSIAILDRWGRMLNTQPLSSAANAESIVLNNLPVDTYFIRIYPEAGATASNYDLGVSLENGDDLPSQATPLGVLDIVTRPTVTFEGSVGRADIQDYYRVRLAGAATLRIGLGGFASVFLIQVLTLNGQLIGEGRTSATNSELTIDLAAGAYLLRVSNPLTNAAYHITTRVS